MDKSKEQFLSGLQLKDKNKSMAKSVSPCKVSKSQLHTSCFISYATSLARAVVNRGLSTSYFMSKTIHCN